METPNVVFMYAHVRAHLTNVQYIWLYTNYGPSVWFWFRWSHKVKLRNNKNMRTLHTDRSLYEDSFNACSRTDRIGRVFLSLRVFLNSATQKLKLICKWMKTKLCAYFYILIAKNFVFSKDLDIYSFSSIFKVFWWFLSFKLCKQKRISSFEHLNRNVEKKTVAHCQLLEKYMKNKKLNQSAFICNPYLKAFGVFRCFWYHQFQVKANNTFTSTSFALTNSPKWVMCLF